MPLLSWVTTPLPTVLYDITHDNPSFTALYGTPAISAVTVLNALCVTHCASTKGFDEGYPRNPAVVETRLYRPLHPSMTDWAEDDVRSSVPLSWRAARRSTQSRKATPTCGSS